MRIFWNHGLTVGIQVIGKPFSEQMLLDIAFKIEKNKNWRNQIPQVY
jgi:Asp-tRNA(Asn)/Glu-tRNA(Gln) amidotransferase A subunit family amidase